ncbi:hypothetical protein [Pseudomonas sp. Leaf59]|uniref:hypothetical protein n=1 Tax=Pseudomonas sp. Leaf59 TaxID=2876556 RepID=UPI003FA7DE4B
MFGRKSEQTADPATPQLALFKSRKRRRSSLKKRLSPSPSAVASVSRCCRSAAHRSHPRTARTRTDLRLRLPQTRHWLGWRSRLIADYQSYPLLLEDERSRRRGSCSHFRGEILRRGQNRLASTVWGSDTPRSNKVLYSRRTAIL